MIPAMIIMMGNFSAAATAAAAGSSSIGGGLAADFVALREGFGQLARLIDTYRDIRVRLQEGCRSNTCLADKLSVTDVGVM
jgi:hypothetical protein